MPAAPTYTNMKEDLITPVLPWFKLYSRAEIVAATLLCGPLAGGYMIAHNFKKLHDHKRARSTWMITILILVVIVAIAVFVEQLPNYVLPITYTIITSQLVTRFQQPAITEHIDNHGGIYSGWRVLLIGIISLFLTLAPLVLIAVLADLYMNQGI